ncbi:hypothetical protein Hanom_Chr09g00813541 [Helianthus anomalus]
MTSIFSVTARFQPHHTSGLHRLGWSHQHLHGTVSANVPSWPLVALKQFDPSFVLPLLASQGLGVEHARLAAGGLPWAPV